MSYGTPYPCSPKFLYTSQSAIDVVDLTKEHVLVKFMQDFGLHNSEYQSLTCTHAVMLLCPYYTDTTSVHPSLQANQTQLKRAVTANSLSQKIASRPGPLSLIQKGILDPTNNYLVGAVKQLPLPTGEELDDGGMATNSAASQQGLQQKKRQQQRHSVATMGGQSGQVSSQSSSPFHSGDWNKLTSPISRSMSADVVEDGHEERLRKGSSSSSIPSPPEFLSLESPAHSPSGSVGVRSPPTSSASFRTLQSGRSINKIPTVSPKLCKKQIKSKREKFRFHIYQPPNQKRNMKEVPQKQRSPYSLLVQQQQILLQLQVLQQQHPEMMNTGINFPPIPSDCSPQQHMQILLQTLHKMTENRPNLIPTSKSSPPFSSESVLQKDNSSLSLMATSQQQQHQKTSTTTSFTNESLIQCDNGKKVKFEDVRVNNLKEACKEKKLVVSGKKAELVERLLEHNNGVLPASVMERKDVGPEGRTTTPQELLSSVPTTSPIFKFPSNQPDNVTAPIRTNYMHIKKIQDRFDEDNQKKKLNYISGNNYSGPIAPMPDTVPARYTVQHQKLTNQVSLSIATSNNSSVVNNSLSHAYACESQSHQPLIKKKSLSEPSSPILSPTSPLTLLTEMISGDSSSMLNPQTSRQQLDTVSSTAVKQQYTAQPCNGVAGSSVVYNSGSNPTLMTNEDILFRTKVTPAQPNHRVHRKSLPVLPPYMTGPSVAVKQQVTSAGNSSEYQYNDGSDLYDANGLPVVDSSDQLMDVSVFTHYITVF